MCLVGSFSTYNLSRNVFQDAIITSTKDFEAYIPWFVILVICRVGYFHCALLVQIRGDTCMYIILFLFLGEALLKSTTTFVFVTRHKDRLQHGYSAANCMYGC